MNSTGDPTEDEENARKSHEKREINQLQ